MLVFYYPVCYVAVFLCQDLYLKLCFLDRRFTDSTNRIVNAPTVRIQEPSKTNGINGGVNAAEVSDALTNGKSKKKAYRRL